MNSVIKYPLVGMAMATAFLSLIAIFVTFIWVAGSLLVLSVNYLLTADWTQLNPWLSIFFLTSVGFTIGAYVEDNS